MQYNLLFDTQFKTNNHWRFINCELNNGYLVSNNKIFGIEQDIILPESSRLYLRFIYNILNSNISKITCGIQCGNKLFVSTKIPKQNKNDFISLIEENSTQKIKIHLIFESTKVNNAVIVKFPLLSNLNKLHKSTWVKSFLDKDIKYIDGLIYSNILDYTDIKPEIFNLEKAKVGSIISTLDNIQLEISAKLIKGNKYLLKLDYSEINDLGNIFITYGILKSIKLDDNQIGLIFKADGSNKLVINVKPNDILPYQVNLKHLMIIDIENLSIEKEDIPYLPFI